MSASGGHASELGEDPLHAGSQAYTLLVYPEAASRRPLTYPSNVYRCEMRGKNAPLSPERCPFTHFTRMRTFYEATGALTRAVTFADLARELRRGEGTILRARLAKDTDRRGKPPAYWACAVARLARPRAAELLELAEEMEQRCPRPPERWSSRAWRPDGPGGVTG